MRQAYISQHLMALRETGILTTRREGRFIFYSLVDPAWMEFIQMAAKTAGISHESLITPMRANLTNSCTCPKCNPTGSDPLVEQEGFPNDS